MTNIFRVSDILPIQNSEQGKRQIIWFKPRHSKYVTTKVSKFILSLIGKHFPPQQKLDKLYNQKQLTTRD